MNGAATASGLNVTAATHNPAPATTLMLIRSNIVINVNSLSANPAGPPAVPNSGVKTCHN